MARIAFASSAIVSAPWSSRRLAAGGDGLEERRGDHRPREAEDHDDARQELRREQACHAQAEERTGGERLHRATAIGKYSSSVATRFSECRRPPSTIRIETRLSWLGGSFDRTELSAQRWIGLRVLGMSVALAGLATALFVTAS